TPENSVALQFRICPRLPPVPSPLHDSPIAAKSRKQSKQTRQIRSRHGGITLMVRHSGPTRPQFHFRFVLHSPWPMQAPCHTGTALHRRKRFRLNFFVRDTMGQKLKRNHLPKLLQGIARFSVTIEEAGGAAVFPYSIQVSGVTMPVPVSQAFTVASYV